MALLDKLPWREDSLHGVILRYGSLFAVTLGVGGDLALFLGDLKEKMAM